MRSAPLPMQPAFIRLEDAIRRLYPQCTAAEWAYLRSGFQAEALPAHALFGQLRQEHRLSFVAQGLMRVYYVNPQGQEVTIRFAAEGDYSTDYYAFITQTPSLFHLQSLEPTTLLTASYQHIQHCYQLHPGLERYGRLIAEEVFKDQHQRLVSFQMDPAEQRYLHFLHQHPALFQRISLTHLASYLGIERQSLSRIRKKLVGP